MASLVSYLKDINDKFPQSIEAIVYTHGHEYTPQPLDKKKYKRGKVSYCYYNAYKLSLCTDLIYVEGFAFPDVMDIPMMHAWCADKDGNVIDNTWPIHGLEYFGITFDHEFIHHIQIETELYGVLDVRSKYFRQRFGIDGHYS